VHFVFIQVRMGKEMAAMARKEEETRLKRVAEERQREKVEEDRAREKIKKKLGMKNSSLCLVYNLYIIVLT